MVDPESVLWRQWHMNYCILKSTLRPGSSSRLKVLQRKTKKQTNDEDTAWVQVWACLFAFSSPINKSGAWPAPAPPPEIKNIKTLKEEIWNLKKLSAILYYGGEVDMSAQWDPTSNKDQDFFHRFSIWWWRRWRWWAWFKDQKSKIASKFWYIYGSVTFFCLSFFLFFSAASLLLLCKSLHRQRWALPSSSSSVCLFIRLSVCSSLCLDLLCRVLAFCSCFLLPVCLSVGGAIVVSVSSTQGRQGQSFGYVHIHGRSMASNKQQHYFRRSSTHTDPSDALAPTLSPAAFQQTSKIPPVPL